MEKKKIKLEELSVQSFMTVVDDQEAKKIEGGTTITGTLCQLVTNAAIYIDCWVPCTGIK